MAMKRRALSQKEKCAMLFPYQSWDDRVASRVCSGYPTARFTPYLVHAQVSGRRSDAISESSGPHTLGRKRFRFHDYFLARWRDLLPNATVRRYDDAGHYVLADAREEVVLRAAEFLAANRG